MEKTRTQTSLIKAAEMALDALEDNPTLLADWLDNLKNAREALRQALAQPEQEPVAWIGLYKGIASELAFQDFDIVVDADWTRLPLYTAPPKRKWVGLEDEDVATVKNEFNRGALWAEQILKEKNA